MRAGSDDLATSDLSRTECLVGPYVRGDAAAQASFQAFFGDPAIRVVPLTAGVCERAARIRAAYRLKLPDNKDSVTEP